MATQLVAPFPEFPSDAVLRADPSKKEEDVVASELFGSKPTVIYLNRRPGCLLCRSVALRVSSLAEALQKLGVDLVCVSNAWLPAEIEAFVEEYWKPPLKVYLDVDKRLYAAVGRGSVRRGSLATFLNPFSRVWKNASEAKKTVKEHNLVGDGLTLGGVLAVSRKKGGGKIEVVGGFQETTFGDAPTDEQILELARKAAGFAK